MWSITGQMRGKVESICFIQLIVKENNKLASWHPTVVYRFRFTLFPSHQFYFLSAAAFCVCSPVNCLSSFFQGPYLFRGELSCKQFQNCCQLVVKWQLFGRFVTVKAFSSRQEHVSLAFVFSFQLVNSSCWRLFEIFTCWIRIKLANIFKTARHVEQTKATSFPWRHLSVFSNRSWATTNHSACNIHYIA